MDYTTSSRNVISSALTECSDIMTSSIESISEIKSSEIIGDVTVDKTRRISLTSITDEHLISLDRLCERLNTHLTSGLSWKQAKHVIKNNGYNSFRPPACKVTSMKHKLFSSCRRWKFTRNEWERLVAQRIPKDVKVIRDGQVTTILGKAVVVGDIVLLGRNDIVPADIRLIESVDVVVDNRLITGQECEPRTHVEWNRDCLLSPNMVFSCTRVLWGQCVGVVVRTGDDTVFGTLKDFAVRVKFQAEHQR